MSRAERRAYKRMTKNQDPYALPGSAAQRARAERQRARRGRGAGGAGSGASSRRFWTWAIIAALSVGFVAFSLQWGSGMPTALYIGLAAAAVTLMLLLGARFLGRRAVAARRTD